MIHFLVLFNLASLAFGLWTLGTLWSRYSGRRDRGDLLNLRFHLADSLLMILGASFAYVFVNISSSQELQKIFAGLILAGMGALMVTLPPMTWHASPRGAGPGLRRFWTASAVFTALQGVLLWFSPPEAEPVFLTLGFAAFSAVVALTLVQGVRLSRSAGGPAPLSRVLAGLYLGLGGVTALEAVYLHFRTDREPYLALSLPLAYILTSLQLLNQKQTPAAAALPPAGLELPAELIRTAGLSPREAEIAAGVLEGKSNKELAALLGLSENTVRNHIYNLYQKLGIQKRMDLVGLAGPAGQVRGGYTPQ